MTNQRETLLGYLYAGVTILVGWLFLEEPISPLAILGAVLITAGVVAAQRTSKQENSAGQ